MALGATKITDPADWQPEKIKPLAKQTVAAVIDTVGGSLLSALLPQIRYGGGAFYAEMLGGSTSKRRFYPLFFAASV